MPATRELLVRWRYAAMDVLRGPRSLHGGTLWTGAKDGVCGRPRGDQRRSTLHERIDVVEERRRGPSRIFLIRGLTRSRHSRARAAVDRAGAPGLDGRTSGRWIW